MKLLVFIASLLPSLASAATGTFIAPDGSVTCTLASVQVSAAGNATLTVSNCDAFSCDTVPPPSLPPPVTPPPAVMGDPGHGVWMPNSVTTIFDLSRSSNRTFVPGCIDGQDWRSGCAYNGGMVHGHVYGARLVLTPNSRQRLKIERAEAGEDFSAVRGAVSTIPGSVTATDPRCTFNPINQSVELQDVSYAELNPAVFVIPGLPPIISASTACIVPANTVLYLNFTSDSAQCGHGFECRVQVIE